MEQYRSYTDPQDENDVTNKRYVDKNIRDQIEKVENDINDKFKKSLGDIIVDSIENKNIFNVDFVLSLSQVICNAHVIEDGIRVISNSDTTNDVYAIYRTIDLRGLEGKHLVLSYKTRSNKSVTSSLGGIELFYENAAGNDRTLIEWNATNGFSFQVKDNLGNNYYLGLTFFANRSGNQIYNNEYVDYYDIQIEKGDVPTTFVPYKKYGYNSQESMGKIVVDDIRSKNLVNRIIYGYELGNLGATNVNQNWLITDYISVVPGETYTQSGFSSNYVEFTNSNKEYVSDSRDKTFQVPNGASYVRLNGAIDASSNMQLELGSTATNYSEYKGIGYTSGSNENGSWIKFEDGTMICDIIREYDFTTTTPWGALYESDYINLGNLPQTFIEPPTVTASCVGGTYVCLEAFTPTVSTLGSTWFMRPVAQSDTAKTKIAFIVKGKWK